jgi:nicotinamidase-related amidase
VQRRPKFVLSSSAATKAALFRNEDHPMTDARPTLRSLLALSDTPARLSKSALVLIDCQNTYREGVMQLEGVEPALKECAKLLQRVRDTGATVIHIQHDAGPGTPYDVRAPIGAIADLVAPAPGETVIVKAYPSSFEQTNLDAELKKRGITDLVIAGFMTHVCVNSTARAAFNHGYRTTVVGNATATRALANPVGGVVSAEAMHNGALTALSDIFAIVVPSEDKIPA